MSAPAPPDPTAEHLNLLVVLTDDQGAWARGAVTPEIRTPVLDRLAAEGTVLDRFFCASPVCSPARASLLTGRLPSAHGIHDWLRPEAVAPGPQGDLLAGVPTYPELLAGAGYRCAHVGKWHVGSSAEPTPGFEHWYAHRLGGGPYLDAPIWSRDEATGRPEAPPRETVEPRYFTDALGEEAVTFLRGHVAAADPRPFLLQIATTAPHDPWTGGNHPEELLALYEDTDFPSVPDPEPHPWLRRDAWVGPLADRRAHLAGYAAAVSGVDRMLGGVLEELGELGLLDSTIVLFLSDNGFSCGHHGIWGKGNGTWPLNFWEDSIRVPFLAWGPGRIAAGRVREDLVSATSLLETLLELAGVTAPPDPLRGGRSVAALLREDGTADGPAPVPGAEVLILDEYGDNRMLRTERWKLVLRRRGPTELYDLRSDPGEQQDLSADPAHAEVRAALAERLHAAFAPRTTTAADGWELAVSGDGQTGPLDGSTPGPFAQRPDAPA